jgi:hypothetical protein
MALRPQVHLPIRQSYCAVMPWRSVRKAVKRCRAEKALHYADASEQGPLAAVGSLMRQ